RRKERLVVGGLTEHDAEDDGVQRLDKRGGGGPVVCRRVRQAAEAQDVGSGGGVIQPGGRGHYGVLGLGRRELRRDHVEHALVGGDVGVGAGGLEGVAVLLVLAGEGGGGVEHRLGLDLAALGGGHVGGHGGVLDAGGEGGEV